MIFLVTIMSTAVLFIPSITVEKAKQCAWLAVLLSMSAGLICLGLANALGKRFPQQTLVQYCELLLGKYIGKAVAVGFFLYLFVVNNIVTREFSDYINIVLMPETPIMVLNGLLAVIAVYAAAKGLEVIARVAQFILPLFLGSIIIIIGLGLLEAQPGKLLPLLENGPGPVISGALEPATLIGQIIILTMIFPMINLPQRAVKEGIIAIVWIGVLLTSLTAVTISVFGPILPGDQLFPFVTLAKHIKFTTIQRLEFLVIFIWVSGIVVKVSIFFYLESVAIKQIFGLQNNIIIFGFLIVSHTLLSTLPFNNPQETNFVLSNFWPPFALVFEFFVPAGLLAIAIIRGKKVVLRK